MCFCLIKEVKLQLIMTMIISDIHTINHILMFCFVVHQNYVSVSNRINIGLTSVLYARLDFRLHNAIWNRVILAM